MFSMALVFTRACTSMGVTLLFSPLDLHSPTCHVVNTKGAPEIVIYEDGVIILSAEQTEQSLLDIKLQRQLISAGTAPPIMPFVSEKKCWHDMVGLDLL